MDASFVPRFLLLEPAMGFGRPRLVMASVRVGARLPRGVRDLSAVPNVTYHAPSDAAPPLVLPFSTRVCAASSSTSTSTSSERARPVVVAAWDVGTGGQPITFFTAPAPVAGTDSALFLPTAGSSSTRRRSVVARASADAEAGAGAGATPPHDTYALSSKHITEWVALATFRTKLEVAVDAGILSARELRLSLDEIGDITMPAPDQDLSAYLDRITPFIGEKIQLLVDAKPREDDHEFMWTAASSKCMILALQPLMSALYAETLLSPASTLQRFCPSFLRLMINVVCEFSRILERTKFERPKYCLSFRMLEAYALALEHAYAVILDIRQQCGAPNAWIEGLEELRSRRITLSEKDIGFIDYVAGVGMTDLMKVLEVLEDTTSEVKMSL